jgi:flagella basal body P-ring formation protein FlgA
MLTLMPMLLAAACARAEVAVVTLKPRAVVATAEFKLADVADVDAADEASAEALRGLVVGRIGGGAMGTRLTRWELSRYVGRHLPAGTTQVEWRGADTVSAQLETVRLDPARIVERAASELRTALERHHQSVSVKLASRMDAIRFPVAEPALRVRLPSETDGRAQRRMRVDVDLVAGDTLLRTLPLWFEVQAHAECWVALRDLPAAHVLQGEDVERRVIDVARQGVDPASGEVAGGRLRKAVKAGSALAAGTVEPMPLVLRQDDVIVEVRSGAVVIESHGKALADGRTGDMVPVRLSGAELLRGRVVGAKRLAL